MATEDKIIKLIDGVNPTIQATVFQKNSTGAVATAIVDASGAQITSFGGGTQYTEGDTVSTITGTALLWEDTSDTLRVVSAAKPLPVAIISGGGNGGTASSFNAAFPATGTAIGVYNGSSNMVALTLGQTTMSASVPVTFASNQSTLPISGDVTNAGTFAVQATEADGANVTLGAKADAKSTATDTTAVTIMQVLKEISFMEQNPASRAVTNTGTFAVQATLAAETTKVIGTVRNLGNGGATLDSTVGAGAAPTNQVVTGLIYNATAPAPTDGQAMANQADQAGNTRVFNGIALKALSAWNSGTSLNATQSIITNSGANAVLVHLVQTTTLTAGAITFEVTYDNSNWITIPANCVLDPTSGTYPQISLPYTVQASTNKGFLIQLNGAQGLRIKLSTQITGSGSVTPNYALLNYSPASTIIAYSPTAANFKVDLSGSAANSTAGLISVKTDQTTHGTTDLVAADITKVAGTSIVNGGVAGSLSIGGTVATNVAITANPINLGAQAVSSENTAVTTARQVQLVADLVGKLIVMPYANPENFVNGTTAAITDTTSTQVIASAGGSLRNYITSITVTNSHATVGTFVKILDGSTIIWEGYAAAAGGGFTQSFPVPLRGTAATAVNAQPVTTGANVIVSCAGYKGV